MENEMGTESYLCTLELVESQRTVDPKPPTQ